MNVPLWIWILTIGLTVVVLSFDMVMIARNPHRPSTREVATALAGYIGAAVLFGVGVWIFGGATYGQEYFAGWLTEYSLSIDNLFIFIIIMAKFSVPRELEQTALMIGIATALVMRGIFIAVGAAAINQFSWVFYIFGAFLVYTAVKLAKEGTGGNEESKDNRMVLWVQKRFPATTEYHGPKMLVKQNGARLVTPMLMVVIALGTTDLMFALDSIPAIFGLTQEPYLVLTANVFALMGLRQLYFLLGDMLKRLVYLSYGLAVLLAFIGVKLVLHALHENTLPFINGGEPVHAAPEISVVMSLGAIIVILGVTTLLSLWATRGGSRDGAPRD